MLLHKLLPLCCALVAVETWATPLARAQEEQEGAPVHPTAVGIAIVAATALLSIAPR